MSSWKSLSSGEFLWNHLSSIIHQDQPTCELWRKIFSKHVWDQEREHVKHSKLCKHSFKNWTKIEQKLNKNWTKIEPKLLKNWTVITSFTSQPQLCLVWLHVLQRLRNILPGILFHSHLYQPRQRWFKLMNKLSKTHFAKYFFQRLFLSPIFQLFGYLSCSHR